MLSIKSVISLLIVASISEACNLPGSSSAGTTGTKTNCGNGVSADTTSSSTTGKVYGTCGSHDETGETQTMQQLQPGRGRMSPRNKIMPWLVFISTPTANCTGIILQESWIATLQSCVAGAASITVYAGANVTISNGGVPCPSQSPGGGSGGQGGRPQGGMGGGMEGGHMGPPQGGQMNQQQMGPRPLPPPRIQIDGGTVFSDSRYDPTTHAYDVALVKLSTPFTFDQPDIQPACLPSAYNCTQQCSTSTSGTGYAHGWVPNSDSPMGGQFSQIAVAFNATINACQATTTTTSTVGSKASILTVSAKDSSYQAQRACLFPNGPIPGMFTFVCCILDFITTTIANN